MTGFMAYLLAKNSAKSYTDAAISLLPKGFVFKGEVDYYSDLPATGQEVGDTYTVKYRGTSGTAADGAEYAWGAVDNVNQWIRIGADDSLGITGASVGQGVVVASVDADGKPTGYAGALKQDAPTIVEQTAPTTIALADNAEYYLTDVSDLTLTYPTGKFACWIRLTTAATGSITITLPTSSYIGDTPAFDVGETWELSIKDGVVIAGEVT